MLKAIGFTQSNGVFLLFLLETSFIAIIGRFSLDGNRYAYKRRNFASL